MTMIDYHPTPRTTRDPMQDTAATVTALHRRVLALEGLVRQLTKTVKDLEGRERI